MPARLVAHAWDGQGWSGSQPAWANLDLGTTRRDFIGAALAGGLLSAALPVRAHAPSGDPGLSFLVVGDWGRDGKAYQRHVATVMGRVGEEADAKFTLSTGDNFYNLGVSSPHDRQWQTSFEDIYRHPTLGGPWFPVLGNHDYGGSVIAQLKRTTESSRWQMRDRWFELSERDHGRSDLQILLIDTVLWLGRESFPYGWLGSGIDHELAAEQRHWLAERLSAARGIKHKLVVGHHPILSVGPHGGRPVKPKMEQLDRLLRQHGVTAYVCGHDHCLYAIEHQGMHYVCSGGGSEELRRFSGDSQIPGCVLPRPCGSDAAQWYSYVDRAGFALFHVDDQAVRFRFVDRAGLTTPMMSLTPAGLLAGAAKVRRTA